MSRFEFQTADNHVQQFGNCEATNWVHNEMRTQDFCRQRTTNDLPNQGFIDFAHFQDPFNTQDVAESKSTCTPNPADAACNPGSQNSDQALVQNMFDTLEKYVTPQQMIDFLEDMIQRLLNKTSGNSQDGGSPPNDGQTGNGDGTGRGESSDNGNSGGNDGTKQTPGKDTVDSHGMSAIPSHATKFSNVETSEWRKNGNQAETALPAGADASTANPKNKITRMDVNHGPDGTTFYTEGTNYADSLFAHTLSNKKEDENANHFRWSFDITGGKNADKAQAMEMDLWQARKEGDHHQRYMFGSQITGNKFQIWDEKNQHWLTAAELPTLKPGQTYHMEYDLVRTDDGRMWYKGVSVNGQKLDLQHNIQMSRKTDWSNPSIGLQYQQDLKNGVPWSETVNNVHVAAWQDTSIDEQLRQAGLK